MIQTHFPRKPTSLTPSTRAEGLGTPVKPRLALRFLAAFATIVVASVGTFATAQQQKLDTPPIYWPETARPKVEVRQFYTTFDGAHVPIVSIQDQQYSFEIFKRPGLSIGNAASARFSANIEISDAREITIALSLFKKDEFLPDLSDETWASYKRGLLQSNRAKEFVFEDSNIESPATPYVFGLTFRQISYLANISGKELQAREIFAHTGNTLIVFTILGSPDSVTQNWQKIDQLISEFTLN